MDFKNDIDKVTERYILFYMDLDHLKMKYCNYGFVSPLKFEYGYSTLGESVKISSIDKIDIDELLDKFSERNLFTHYVKNTISKFHKNKLKYYLDKIQSGETHSGSLSLMLSIPVPIEYKYGIRLEYNIESMDVFLTITSNIDKTVTVELCSIGIGESDYNRYHAVDRDLIMKTFSRTAKDMALVKANVELSDKFITKLRNTIISTLDVYKDLKMASGTRLDIPFNDEEDK